MKTPDATPTKNKEWEKLEKMQFALKSKWWDGPRLMETSKIRMPNCLDTSANDPNLGHTSKIICMVTHLLDYYVKDNLSFH